MWAMIRAKQTIWQGIRAVKSVRLSEVEGGIKRKKRPQIIIQCLNPLISQAYNQEQPFKTLRIHLTPKFKLKIALWIKRSESFYYREPWSNQNPQLICIASSMNQKLTLTICKRYQSNRLSTKLKTMLRLKTIKL